MKMFTRVNLLANIKYVLLATWLLSYSVASANDQLSDIFGEGVFDTKWGDSLAQIEEVHPGGKYKSSYEMHVYTVKSSRTVLGSDSKKELTFQFAEPEEKLNKVFARFPMSDYVSISNKLTNILGEGDTNVANANGTTGYIQWESEDGSLTVSVYMAVVFRGYTYISITKRITAEATKEELGF